MPYADFLTLLLALFVVLYAISQASEGKSRALADSLVSAFGNNRPASARIIGMAPDTQLIEHKPVREPTPQPAPEPVPHVSDAGSDAGPGGPERAEIEAARRSAEMRRRQQERLEAVARDLMTAFAPFASLLENGQVKLIRSTAGLGVEINARVLFAPGQATVQEGSGRVLEAVARALKETDHRIQVEGHTDSIPILTERFPSNWELSAVRASSVVRLLIGNGVEAARLTALGYGDNRPVETNDTEEGRMRNRRVTVLILSGLPDMESDDVPEISPNRMPDGHAEPASAISSV